MNQDHRIESLLYVLISKLSDSFNSFEDYYFHSVSRELVYNKGITEPPFFKFAQGVEIGTIDQVHKLSVLYTLFFKNNVALREYIAAKIFSMNKPLSRYTLKNLFLYCSCIKKVGGSIRFSELLAYIDQFYCPDGSYSNYYGTSGNIGATFDAVLLKKQVLPSFCLSDQTMEYFESCYCTGIGFATNPQKTKVSISSIFDGYFISTLFGFVRKESISDIISYIERSYNLFNKKQLFQGILILRSILDKDTYYFEQIY